LQLSLMSYGRIYDELRGIEFLFIM